MKEITLEQAIKHIEYMETKKLTIKYDSLYNNLCEFKEACINRKKSINHQHYEKAAYWRNIERQSINKIGNDLPSLLRDLVLEEILNS